MDKYLIKYLRDNAPSELVKKYIDFFKVELDWLIYNGDLNISKDYHRDSPISLKKKIVKLLQIQNALFVNDKFNSNKLNVLSTVYFNDNKVLEKLNLNLVSPIYNPVGRKKIFGDLKTINWHRKIEQLIRFGNLNSIIDPELHESLEVFQNHLIKNYKENEFKALFLNTDQYFKSKYLIDIFKKLEKPSLLFTHGLPGVYSLDVDNKSDFLIVWGEKIKNNYIDAGFSADKIKVSGSLKYNSIKKNKDLKSNLSNVLVIPTSIVWHQNEYDNTIVIDKSTAILYLYKVQNVLISLGVNQARYRVHPSINKKWIHNFLDTNFYIQDNETVESSLYKSSLVIGSTSTMLLDSLMAGVNYLVFEPIENGLTMMNAKAVPPFDGSESKIMLSKTEDELRELIKANEMTDQSLLQDYIQEFDFKVLKDIFN